MGCVLCNKQGLHWWTQKKKKYFRPEIRIKSRIKEPIILAQYKLSISKNASLPCGYMLKLLLNLWFLSHSFHRRPRESHGIYDFTIHTSWTGEHAQWNSVITNKIFSPKWPFYYANQPGYNEHRKKFWSRSVRNNRAWLYMHTNTVHIHVQRNKSCQITFFLTQSNTI